jgi:hypothetical protein
MGNLPNSDRTPKFVDFLWTPKINLQNLVCSNSHLKFWYILSNVIVSFLNLAVVGLKLTHILHPYSKIGLIVWSNTCKLVLILGFRVNKMNCELMLTYDTPALRQTGSRNLTGPKTLPTIWGTYMKLVIKYQISAINSCWEKCDEKCAYTNVC